nr:MAG TPA: hypothetical protein [Caudoviricetes sp.]
MRRRRSARQVSRWAAMYRDVPICARCRNQQNRRSKAKKIICVEIMANGSKSSVNGFCGKSRGQDVPQGRHESEQGARHQRLQIVEAPKRRSSPHLTKSAGQSRYLQVTKRPSLLETRPKR